MTIQITRPRLLVVEGTEERLFFEALIRHMGLPDIQVLPIGGKTNLRRNLKALVLSPGFADVVSLGVVRDADEDPAAAFQSIRDALEAVSLPVPTTPLSPTGENPRVTIMILPAENKPGALEDLCLRSVAGDPAAACVENYFQCLQKQGLRAPQNLSKAWVQAFLASRQEAGKRLGEAAQAGYWPWSDNAFADVRNFLSCINA
jgi:hypothetical protein